MLKQTLVERGHEVVDFYDEFLIDVYSLLDKPQSKHIAIDWDNTINADQDFFKQLIKHFQAAGYLPFVCTLRAPDKENIAEISAILENANIPLFLTNGRPKREFMRKQGVDVHLWIDDFYPSICNDSCKLLLNNHIK